MNKMFPAIHIHIHSLLSSTLITQERAWKSGYEENIFVRCYFQLKRTCIWVQILHIHIPAQTVLTSVEPWDFSPTKPPVFFHHVQFTPLL